MAEAAKIPQRLGYLIASPKAYARQKTLLAGFRWLRSNLPVGKAEVEGFDPFWVITKHADVVTVGRDAETYSSHQGRGGVVGLEARPEDFDFEGGGNLMLTMDPPEHTRYRKLVNRAFTPRAIRLLEGRLRAASGDHCETDHAGD